MEIKFRNSDSLDEIKNIVKSSKAENTIVWQNSHEGRKIFSCNSVVLNETIQTVQLHLKNYDYSLLINMTIYIKLSYNHSLFKGQVISIEGNILSVYLPQEVKTIENRLIKREVFMPKEAKKVIFDVAKDITVENGHRLSFKALDISKNGISVIVSESNKNLVMNAGKQMLIQLGDEPLEFPILLDLRYEQKFRYREAGKVINANRFGFKFMSELSEADMSRFIQDY